MAAITICSDFRAPQNKVTTVSPSISHEVMGPDVKQINIRVHVHVCVQSLSFGQHFVAPWTVAPQAPLPMRFPRQEYWSGLPFSFPGDLANPGIEPTSPALQVILYRLSHQGSPKLGRGPVL